MTVCLKPNGKPAESFSRTREVADAWEYVGSSYVLDGMLQSKARSNK